MSDDLSPQICGLWDGCHLWAQWNAVEGATYLFDWRVRNRDGSWPDERGWRPVRREGGIKRPWLVLPTWMNGAAIQARVAILPASSDEDARWQPAREVTFCRSRCDFEIRSERSPLHLPPGSRIHAAVDGAGCSYTLAQEVAIEPGESVVVVGEAIDASGFHQLDHADHFLTRPRPGVTIRNIAPSVADTMPTGRSFTEIRALEVKSLAVVFTRASVI